MATPSLAALPVGDVSTRSFPFSSPELLSQQKLQQEMISLWLSFISAGLVLDFKPISALDDNNAPESYFNTCELDEGIKRLW